jgi:hypothetical protein
MSKTIRKRVMSQPSRKSKKRDHTELCAICHTFSE